tara:strand:- start:2169 stop:2759 length:591 start_codon:yes stop_codon:yes gene_type:complete
MKNKYQHNDDGTTFIFVESKSKHFPGKHTIVIDTEDWDKAKEHRWRLGGRASQRYPYAATNIPHPDGGYRINRTDGYPRKRTTTLKLHHLIMGKPQRGKVIDHINHIGLDNRKDNLRFVTISQNNQNTRSAKNSSSQYKGVSWCKQGNKWRAQIEHKRKSIHLGYHTCEQEAALVYNKKAIELWGEHALLNEVEIQ